MYISYTVFYPQLLSCEIYAPFQCFLFLQNCHRLVHIILSNLLTLIFFSEISNLHVWIFYVDGIKKYIQLLLFLLFPYFFLKKMKNLYTAQAANTLHTGKDKIGTFEHIRPKLVRTILIWLNSLRKTIILTKICVLHWVQVLKLLYKFSYKIIQLCWYKY